MNPKIEYLGPVVDRVRAIRRQIAEECDYDVHKMADLLRHAQAEHSERVATPKRRPNETSRDIAGFPAMRGEDDAMNG